MSDDAPVPQPDAPIPFVPAAAAGPAAGAAAPAVESAGPVLGAASAVGSAVPAGAVARVAKPVDVPAFFAALGNPLRWAMVRMLASGKALAASQVASALGRDFDGVSKHLRILRKARVLASRSGEDRRLELYFIPEANRRADGALDYGFCVVRVG